jgi:hypothetical protein
MGKQDAPGSLPDERLRRWHRLFGLLLTDHHTTSSCSTSW